MEHISELLTNIQNLVAFESVRRIGGYLSSLPRYPLCFHWYLMLGSLECCRKRGSLKRLHRSRPVLCQRAKSVWPLHFRLFYPEALGMRTLSGHSSVLGWGHRRPSSQKCRVPALSKQI